MQLTQKQQERVQEIMASMECPKGFPCYESNFEQMPNTKVVADGKVVECLEPKSATCSYALPFGFGRICTCPLRAYIAATFRA